MKSKKASLSKKALFVMIMLSPALIFGFAHQSLATIIYVDDDTCPATGSGTAVDPYCSIQYAITQANSGDTVEVRAGTYNETITMKDGVHLVSAAGETPSIVAASPGNWRGIVEFNGGVTCNLAGFTIQNSSGTGSGIFLDGSGTQVNATIDDCIVNYGAEFGVGIRLKGLVSVTITGCNINRSGGGDMRLGIGTHGWEMSPDRLASNSSITIKDTTIGGSGQGFPTAGIRLRGPVGTGATNNIQVTIGGSTLAEGNIISHNTEAGIVLADINKVSIENNTISNNGKGGILLVDASTASPHIRNNTIENHSSAAGINIGGASSVTIADNNQIHSNKTGIAFYVANNANIDSMYDDLTRTVSSQPVTIRGNNIHTNTKAGIAVIDNATGTITIDDNEIHQNTQAGIAFFNACTAVITDNEIYTHTGAAGIFTGDWSGILPEAGTGFDRTNGPAILTIQRNKVYGNRAGMRLDHASGTITNNLVYGNSRGGIRFSGNNVSPYAPFSASWGMTEIKNNTVADNGSYVAAFSEYRGAGIAYDDISDTTGRNFYDPPVGATQNPITIKNNIVANNMKAGIKYCADNTGDNRSYNLFYQNQKDSCATGGSVDCSRSCRSKTLGRCDAPDVNCCDQDTWAGMDTFPGSWATGEICGQDPRFNADYTLQTGSPAIGTGSDNNDMGAYGGTDPILW